MINIDRLIDLDIKGDLLIKNQKGEFYHIGSHLTNESPPEFYYISIAIPPAQGLKFLADPREGSITKFQHVSIIRKLMEGSKIYDLNPPNDKNEIIRQLAKAMEKYD